MIKFKKRITLQILFGFIILNSLNVVAQDKLNSIVETANEKLNITIEDKHQPLYLINTKQVSKDVIIKLDSIAIKSLTILRAEKAKEKYGRKGKNGAVEVITKDKWKIL